MWAFNPFGISKDTGDKTFMEMTIPYEYTGAPPPTPPVARKRPASSESSFYRDCYVLDTDLMARSDQISSWTFTFMAQLANFYLGEETLLKYIPTMVTQEEAARLAQEGEQTFHSADLIDTRVKSEEEPLEDVINV